MNKESEKKISECIKECDPKISEEKLDWILKEVAEEREKKPAIEYVFSKKEIYIPLGVSLIFSPLFPQDVLGQLVNAIYSNLTYAAGKDIVQLYEDSKAENVRDNWIEAGLAFYKDYKDLDKEGVRKKLTAEFTNVRARTQRILSIEDKELSAMAMESRRPFGPKFTL